MPDVVRLAAAVRTVETDLKRITSWCVASRFNAQVLEEKYAEESSKLKSLAIDIVTVSHTPPPQPTLDSRVSNLDVAFSFFLRACERMKVCTCYARLQRMACHHTRGIVVFVYPYGTLQWRTSFRGIALHAQ
jgi:uncharacterized Rmd1/YagE family protein